MTKKFGLTVLGVALLAGWACGRPATDSTPAASPGAEPTAGGEPASAELVRNARQPLPGLLTGGQPSVEQLENLGELGYRTVVNLRAEGEPGTGRTEVEALGMDYVAIPVDGAAGLTRANAEALAAALAEAEEPVLLHCGSGNRVGALLAMKAFAVDGASAEEALELGLAAGVTRLEPTVREKLGLEE